MSLVLKTNRCFFGSHDNPSLSLGQELPGRIVWTVDEKNRYRLCILAFAGDRQIPCLRWRQPWYLDCQRWVCGPVALDVPMVVVELIQTFRAMTLNEARVYAPCVNRLVLLV